MTLYAGTTEQFRAYGQMHREKLRAELDGARQGLTWATQGSGIV